MQGGKEAARSNAILHKIISETIEAVAPEVGSGLINLVTTRQGVDDLLELEDVIDLVSVSSANFTEGHTYKYLLVLTNDLSFPLQANFSPGFHAPLSLTCCACL